ncbi:hypothetical protein [Arcobacter sp. s6]|jgi:hypothetical protein|uniref:hypothetical protein n=1 Tax=Arcobacter sp. s6 TaxID=3230363 RepID=UPI00349FE804
MAEESKVVEDLKIKDELSDANTLTIENEDNDKISNEDDKYKDILEVKEDITKSKKKSLLSKILIGLIIFLFLLLAVGISLYFLGFFTPKEDTTPVVENSMPVEVKEETYKFDIKDINSKKLNEQLSFLTNKNINKEKNEELEKLENEKRIIEEEKRREAEALKIKEEALLKEKEAIEEKKTQLENEKAELEAMKQEALMLKEQLEMNKSKLEANTEENKNTVIPVAIEKKENDIPTLVSKDKKFLKFINVAKIKGSLYKKYLDKVSSVNPNAILCRDDKNRIEIYFGPFEDDETRSNLLDKLIKNKFQEAYEVEFTKDEFDKRCNY